MLTRNMTQTIEMSTGLHTLLQRVRPSLWHIILGVSVVAGMGSSGRVVARQAELPTPVTAAVTMMVATFVGWYVWGFFIHLADRVFFDGHVDYRGTLNAFGRAYVFQALFLFTFTQSLGWLWGWIAFYCTVAAWGIIGPRYLGMRTWQAIVAATLGMLVWLACLLVLTLTLTWDGVYVGVGAFLV